MNIKIVEKLAKAEHTTWSTREIKELVDDDQLDLNPIYQREEVWPPEYMSDLISSVLVKYPIPSLTVVRNGLSFISLDGKQRISSLILFYKNKIKVCHHSFGNEDGLTYSEMKKSPIEEVQFLAKEFQNAKLEVIILPEGMSVLEQLDVFKVLNQSKQLGTNERHYCYNFLTKALLSHVWDNSLGLYKTFQNRRSMKRFGNLRLVHGILFRTFGTLLNESEELINKRALNILVKQSEEIHRKLLGLGFSESDIIDESYLKKAGIKESIGCFISVSKALQNVLESDGMQSKWHDLFIRDMLMYFIYMDWNNLFTCSQMTSSANIRLVKDTFIEYANTIYDPDFAYKSANNNANTISDRLKILDGIFRNQCKNYSHVNLSEKRKDFSVTQKLLAKINSDGKCPICKEVFLTDDNCHIDHVNPKSQSSETQAVAVCKACNLSKSGHTKEGLEMKIDYMKNYSE